MKLIKVINSTQNPALATCVFENKQIVVNADENIERLIGKDVEVKEGKVIETKSYKK